MRSERLSQASIGDLSTLEQGLPTALAVAAKAPASGAGVLPARGPAAQTADHSSGHSHAARFAAHDAADTDPVHSAMKAERNFAPATQHRDLFDQLKPAHDTLRDFAQADRLIIAQTETLKITPAASATDGIGQTVVFPRQFQDADPSYAAAFKAMKTGPLQHFDSQLAQLYQQHANPGAWASAGSKAGISAETGTTGKYVTIDVTAKDGDGRHLLQQLDHLDFQHGASFGAMASGEIAISDLGKLLKIGDFGHASQAIMATNIGDVTTQADSAQHNDTARSDFGVDGTDIKVGVLSDSFNLTAPSGDNMAADQASGDLPSNTTIFQEGTAGGEDEGRGMAQLIHDLAPGASIEFATADGGDAAFAANIQQLVTDGCNVIVDDVTYFDEPAFQDGVISQAIDSAVASGVTYFTSAANNENNGWEAGYTDSGFTDAATNEPLAKLSGGSGAGTQFMTLTFAPGASATIILNWDEPAASADNNAAGSQSDLDLFAYQPDGVTLITKSDGNNINGDPNEFLSLVNNGLTAATAKIAVGLFSGNAPDDMKIIVRDNGSGVTIGDQSMSINNGTIFGHAAASGAITVGAAGYADTPAFGQTPPLRESFSSVGPTRILFDIDGNRLASPDVREGPQITGVDGGNTTFFGSDDTDADRFPNFYGTSAAAPDAAATAALMLDARDTLDHTDILHLLEDTAHDMDSAGFDTNSGFGLIDAHAAVGAAKTLTITGNAQHEALQGTHLNDKFSFASGFNGNSNVNGGTGADALALTHSASLAFNSSTIVSIEKITLASGNYTLTLANGNIAAGKTLTLDASALLASQKVIFNGSAETNGILKLSGGAGKDTLTGGHMADTLTGHGGADLLTGGAGDDTFSYAKVMDSASVHYDTVSGFDASADKFNLSFVVTKINATVKGKLDTSSFDTELAAALTPQKLGVHHAALFVATSGSLKGQTFLVIDANGHAGYQKNGDLVIDLSNAQHLSSLSVHDFI